MFDHKLGGSEFDSAIISANYNPTPPMRLGDLIFGDAGINPSEP